MNRLKRHALIMGLIMFVLGVGMPLSVPSRLLADTRGGTKLEAVIPERFQDWVMLPTQAAGVVNPYLDQMLTRLYSETVSRTYVNSKGYRVMLSLAYGRDQRGSLQLHYPEVCYPAQGFSVRSNVRDTLRFDDGAGIMVRRLETDMGRVRPEPVTYWTMIGNTPALGGFEKKRIEASYALQGWVPDGVLFRVSSIDADSKHAFEIQDSFVRQLMQAIPPAQSVRLRGEMAGHKG